MLLLRKGDAMCFDTKVFASVANQPAQTAANVQITIIHDTACDKSSPACPTTLALAYYQNQ